MTEKIPTNKDACTDRSLIFNYDLDAAPKGQELMLLNCGGVAIKGKMPALHLGKNKAVWAWHPLPVRDRDEEKRRSLR